MEDGSKVLSVNKRSRSDGSLCLVTRVGLSVNMLVEIRIFDRLNEMVFFAVFVVIRAQIFPVYISEVHVSSTMYLDRLDPIFLKKLLRLELFS